MDDASDFGIELPEGSGVEAEVGQAYIAGEDPDTGTVLRRQERVGSLAARLPGLVADKQNQGDIGILVEEQTDEMSAQESSSTRY